MVYETDKERVVSWAGGNKHLASWADIEDLASLIKLDSLTRASFNSLRMYVLVIRNRMN